MPKDCCDVLIIGGGLVGLSLAKGLERLQLSYRLVDPSLGKTLHDGRALALSKTSLAILTYLGLDFRKLDPSPIQSIHVSCEHTFGKLTLNEPQHDFLGQVINLVTLYHHLLESLKEKASLIPGKFFHYDRASQLVQIDIDGELHEFTAKFVIAADGADSPLRKSCELPIETQAEQAALLAFIENHEPHDGQAFERFTTQGPLALLPWGLKSYAMIWGMMPSAAQAMLDMGSEAVLRAVKQQFAAYHLDLSALRELHRYPLKQVFMPKQHLPSMIFLGNAAHTLHPVAGQGFNLSLRDVAVLLEAIQNFGLGPELGPIYVLNREADQRMTQNITRFLAAGMQKISVKLPHLGGWGLTIAQHCPGIKSWFSVYAQGLGYPLPSWVYDELDKIYD